MYQLQINQVKKYLREEHLSSQHLSLVAASLAKKAIVALTYKGTETRKINVECKLNGWYFGNLIIGGLIGMLIVDPATGAMYRLESKDIYEVFTEDKTSQLKILNINSIPLAQRAHLIEL